METIADLFFTFGGPARVGQAIGVSTEHAAAMKRRGSIPVDYWPSLIECAKARRIRGVTAELLMQLHSVAA